MVLDEKMLKKRRVSGHLGGEAKANAKQTSSKPPSKPLASGLVKATPSSYLSSSSSSSTTRSKEKPSTASPFHQPCVEAYFKAYESATGQKPTPMPKDFKALSNLLLNAGVTLDQFVVRLPIMFKSDWAKKQGFTLLHFCTSWQKYAPIVLTGQSEYLRLKHIRDCKP